MGWRVFGEKIFTADAATTRVHQPFKPDKNILVKAFRTWLIFYNNPTWTGTVTMDIYNTAGGDVPGTKILHSSTNSFTKGDIITDLNGVREIYFQFNDVPLKEDDTYHCVHKFTSYTGTDASHIAWRLGFPEPVYEGYAPKPQSLCC